MGWAQPDHPEIRELAAAPGALRSAAARAVGEAMRRASRTRAVALVIDDAQFAGETALDAIEYATLKEAGCPIWVCVIGRPVVRPGPHRLGAARGAPPRARRCRRSTRRPRPSWRAACSRPRRTCRRARSAASPNARRACRCCSSSSCAASSATGSCARRSAARRGTWRPTSSSACPICRSCSGCRRARPSRCRPSCSRTRGWRRSSASSSAPRSSRACSRSWIAAALRPSHSSTPASGCAA